MDCHKNRIESNRADCNYTDYSITAEGIPHVKTMFLALKTQKKTNPNGRSKERDLFTSIQLNGVKVIQEMAKHELL